MSSYLFNISIDTRFEKYIDRKYIVWYNMYIMKREEVTMGLYKYILPVIELAKRESTTIISVLIVVFIAVVVYVNYEWHKQWYNIYIIN